MTTTIKYSTKLRHWAKKRKRMYDLHSNGWSLAKIGRKYGVSRQRVLAVIKRFQ